MHAVVGFRRRRPASCGRPAVAGRALAPFSEPGVHRGGGGNRLPRVASSLTLLAPRAQHQRSHLRAGTVYIPGNTDYGCILAQLATDKGLPKCDPFDTERVLGVVEVVAMAGAQCALGSIRRSAITFGGRASFHTRAGSLSIVYRNARPGNLILQGDVLSTPDGSPPKKKTPKKKRNDPATTKKKKTERKRKKTPPPKKKKKNRKNPETKPPQPPGLGGYF